MRSVIKVLIVMCLVGMLAACNSMKNTNSTTDPSSSPQTNYQEPDYYLDFDDIRIPKEIDYKPKESYKLDNAKFRASIMRFTGRVEVTELIQYFLNNMAQDNWTLVSNNKASEINVLNFEKYNKSCVIQVEDGMTTVKTSIFAVEVKDSGPSVKEQ